MIRILSLLVVLFWANVSISQEFSGLARLDTEASVIDDHRRGGVSIDLALSQGVPWRIFTLSEPDRLVIDFREVDWSGVEPDKLNQAGRIGKIYYGVYRPGWSRFVADLSSPMVVDTAEMAIDDASGAAKLNVILAGASQDEFNAKSGVPNDPTWDLPAPAESSDTREEKPDWAPTVVVLDPGHGGVDPGAEYGNTREKDLMLRFARELRDTLRRAGGFEVILTRDSDTFVSLEGRVAIAHQVKADLFISLHADALSSGSAHGATVYTLSDEASDAASQYLAERHERSDLLAGLDLSGTDDLIANVLLDLVRQETKPRSERLAKAMVLGMKGTVGELNRKPYREGGFSVLKAADIPSVLIEVGFMSSPRDLENLVNPEWRRLMADGIRDGLQAWVIADKAARGLVRR